MSEIITSSFPLKGILAVSMPQDDEAMMQKTNQQDFKKRSNSFLGRLFSKDDNKDSCAWLYEFSIEMAKRTYEFRSATKEDRAHWVRIFQIIVEMNKEHVTTNFMNPFDFDQKRKEIEAIQENIE